MPGPLTLPVRYGRTKPPLGVPLRRGNPLARGLVLDYVHPELGGLLFNAAGPSGRLTVTGNLPRVVTPLGGAIEFPDTANPATRYASGAVNAPWSTALTFALWLRSIGVDGQTVAYPISTAHGGGVGMSLRVGGSYSDTQLATKAIALYDATNADSAAANTWTDASDSVLRMVVCTYDGALGSSRTAIYKDGLPLTMATRNIVGTPAAPDHLYLGCRADLNWPARADVARVMVYSRALSAVEVRQLYLAPFFMF